MSAGPLPLRRHTPSPDAEEDARLIAASVGGDRRAFAALYQRHMDPVYARLTRLIGPVVERDDLVQQIFLDVFRALPRFRGEATFSTFLHRIVLNVAFEHLERRQRSRGRSEPLDQQQLDALLTHEASPEARAHQRQDLAQAFRWLEALSPKRRVAFVLVAVDGLPLGEAASLLGVSLGALKQRVIEARRELTAARARSESEEPRP